MKITANSKTFDIPENTTIAAFIEQLGLNPKKCVLELNKKAMRFSQFADIKLSNGDILEIMNIVAGG